VLTVSGLNAQTIAHIAYAHHILLVELTPQQASLEDAYLSLLRNHDQHPAARRSGGALRRAAA
jgi:hypothetical protein